MRQLFFLFILFNTVCSSLTGETNVPTQKEVSKNEGIASFTPPAGWSLADSSKFPPTVKVMVVGKGESTYRPSMNLATQPFNGTLKDYLKIVKERNDAKQDEWKDLGMIKIDGGQASLSQVDSKTQWGDIRQMHVILLKNKNIYILTAGALKDEFPKFYKEFFTAMRTLKVNNNVSDMLPTDLKPIYQTAQKNLQSEWKVALAEKQKENPSESIETIQAKVFESEDFKTKNWKPFQDFLTLKFSNMGGEWKNLVLQQTEDNLFEIYP